MSKEIKKAKRAPKQDAKVADSGLTILQEQVAVDLALGETLECISKKYDIARSVIYNWRQMPEFAAHLKRLQREVVRQIRGRLSQMSDRAITRIEEIMEEGGEQAALKAACYILDSMTGEQREAKKMRIKMKSKDAQAK